MAAGGQAPAPVMAPVVWRFLDGKPGHENQTRGLVQALSARVALHVHTLAVPARAAALFQWARAGFPPGAKLPAPDLLIGAGHRTHLAMLSARRARGGRVVVLMKPSLPLSWFDLCLIPAHDRPRRRANVVVTRGALNAVGSSGEHDSDRGLILVGGPSSHYGWDESGLIQQIETVVQRDPATWTLTTSRRTPAATAQRLRQLSLPNLTIVPWQETGPDWLPQQLQGAGRVWVSEDSVSMIYETLTAGAACGALSVPQRRASRVSHGIQQLEQEGRVTPFAAWAAGAPLHPAAEPFNEAQRCAAWICAQWLGC